MIGVYMMVDKFDRVIYVGASRDVDRRIGEHKSKDWWDHVESVETYPMADWDQALYVERNAIAKLAPEFNVQSNENQFASRVDGSLLRFAEAGS